MPLKNNKKLCALIPAYNEEKSIKSVIIGVKKYIKPKDIIVINDGSIDNTSKTAKKQKVTVIDLPSNSGVGSAIKKGFSLSYKRGCDIVIQLDADGQHRPQDIPKIITRLIESNADVVIGSRFHKKTSYKTPLLRKTSIVFLSNLILLLTGKKVYDVTSGFRAYNRTAIKLLIDSHLLRCPEPSTVSNFLKKSLKVKEIKVQMRPRTAGKSSLTFLKGLWCLVKNTMYIINSNLRRS